MTKKQTYSARLNMIVIDGSQGEGGGQILRTSLALAIITNQPVLIERIRAKREKPGLRRQHLAAVRAAADISGGKLRGDELGSRELEFHPLARIIQCAMCSIGFPCRCKPYPATCRSSRKQSERRWR